MTDDPTPRDRRRALAALVKRDLPDRAPASTWCGRHDKNRTVLIARRGWVCLDCVRESSLGA